MRLLLLLLLTSPIFAQGVRFDAYNLTSANNVPFGAQAPIFTMPNSTVTVCAYPDDGGQPCGNVIPIYSNPALNQTADNPITADVHGRFGFWLAPGTYTYSVMTQDGRFAGTYIFTLGGSGGASTCGSVPGDNSSTNCGYNNRTGDTATIPASIQTFGSSLLDSNSGNDLVAMGIYAGDLNTGSIGVFLGDSAGYQNSGSDQVFIGNSTGRSNSGGTQVAIGDQAAQNGSAVYSDFFGYASGKMASTAWTGGSYFDCMGYSTCNNGGAASGTMGSYVVGIGAFSAGDSEGTAIAAVGYAAGGFHAGHDIVAVGQGAGDGRMVGGSTATSGHDVVAIGQGAGGGSGSNVVAIGNRAIDKNGTATGNSGTDLVAIGERALTANTIGTNNIAIGTYAGANGWLTYQSLGNSNLTGSQNTWVGDYAGPNVTTQLNNSIAIGYQAYNTASNQTVIGNSSTTEAHIYGTFFTPASSSAACSVPQTAYDANYAYFCVAPNTWKRVALTSF